MMKYSIEMRVIFDNADEMMKIYVEEERRNVKVKKMRKRQYRN